MTQVAPQEYLIFIPIGKTMDKTFQRIIERIQEKKSWAEGNYVQWGSLRYQAAMRAYDVALNIINEELTRKESDND